MQESKQKIIKGVTFVKMVAKSPGTSIRAVTRLSVDADKTAPSNRDPWC